MADQISDDLIGQRTRRIQKVQKLRQMGIDPYPSQVRKDHSNKEIIDDFSRFEGQDVTLAGRMITFRDHGKLMFADLQDQTGRIQLYFKKDEVQEDITTGFLSWENRKLIDIGDIVEVHGTVTCTSTGQKSLLVRQVRIISKSIRPLPTSLNDKETIFRKRYLDLIINPEHKWRFEKMAQITFAIREFLNKKGFLEIKTPILQPISGGTSARPFKTHINALGVDFSMAISHELYLKRLITAGFENVFNIFGYFRNEGIDRTHNPEFTMLETMTAYKNYQYNMDLTEEMYRYIADTVFQKTRFIIGGQEVDFAKPWERIRMDDAVKKYAGYDFNKITTLDSAHRILQVLRIDEKPPSIGECMVRVFEEKVEEKLIHPTFVMNHPVEISPLAKSCSDDARFVERFEIFIGGMEGGDNWTELNDPQDLFSRLKAQSEKGKAGDEEAHRMDLDFVEMMEYGMPPTTGLGPGIERLAMMFTETEYIDDVIFFPLMKPAPLSKQQQEIYGLKEVEGYETEENVHSKETFVSHAVILNADDIPSWKKMNTAAHLSASLAARKGKKLLQIEQSQSKDKQSIPMNIGHAIVIKQTEDRSSLLTLKVKAEEAGLSVVVFTEQMAATSDDTKVDSEHRSLSMDEIVFLGVLIFGRKKDVERLTKEYKLWE